MTSFDLYMTPALLGVKRVHARCSRRPTCLERAVLPGTMESRLYKKSFIGTEELLWEPTHDADVSALALNADGSSKNEVYTRDIVDYLYSPKPLLAKLIGTIAKDEASLYGPFEKYMDDLVQRGVIREWKSYPYDWRYDVADIVMDGTLVGNGNGAVSRVYLQNVVQELASSSPTGQVTIIAHSNGGLLAKALAVFVRENAPNTSCR